MDFTKNTIKVFDEHAQKYQDKYMDVSLYHELLDEFCDDIIGKNAQILDVACGPGNVSQYIEKKRPDIKILGIDLSEKMIELAKINNPTAKFMVMDCRDIKLLQQKFNGIVCSFCFPYLTKQDVEQLVLDFASLLKIKGIVYASFINGNYEEPSHEKVEHVEQMYMFDHQCEYVKKVFLNANFTVLNTVHLKSPDNATYSTKDTIILARVN